MSALSPKDEKEMVLQLRNGDSHAFGFLYRSYKRQIYAKLKKLLHSEEMAEEVLQEVFFKLWLNRDKLDTEQSFSSYLYRIAANLVYDHFRKSTLDIKMQQHFIAAGSELYDHIEEHINYKESQELINRAIESLPPKRQEIFRLIKLEGKTYEEVSRLLNISNSTIQDHIVKATRVVKAQVLGTQETALLFIMVYLLYQKS